MCVCARAPVQEMEKGVMRANIIITFLDEAYVSSENCLKEFSFCMHYGKFIIPVNVSDLEPHLVSSIPADESKFSVSCVYLDHSVHSTYYSPYYALSLEA